MSHLPLVTRRDYTEFKQISTDTYTWRRNFGNKRLACNGFRRVTEIPSSFMPMLKAKVLMEVLQ